MLPEGSGSTFTWRSKRASSSENLMHDLRFHNVSNFAARFTRRLARSKFYVPGGSQDANSVKSTSHAPCAADVGCTPALGERTFGLFDSCDPPGNVNLLRASRG